MADSGTYDPDTIASRQRIADQLLLQSSKQREIRSPLQGVGQLGEGLIYGVMSGLDDRERREGNAAADATRMKWLGAGGAIPAVAGALNAPTAAAPSSSVEEVSPGDFNRIDAAAPPAPPTAAPVRLASMSPEPGIVAPPRAVVPSSAKVVGDDEGVRLGYYDPPKAPGMAPPSPVANVAGALNPAAGAPPQAAPPPAPVQVAQNAPVPTAGVTPDMKAEIAKGLNDKNPYVRAMARKAADAVMAHQIKSGPEWGKLNDESLFDKHSGKVIPAGPGFKPLVNPAERAAHGIPADDKRPYQLGPGNKLINPPAETRVSIDQRTETAFNTEAGKLQAKKYADWADDAPAAKQMQSDISMLRDLGEKIKTGKLAEVRAVIGPYANALGVDVKGLNEIQAFEAIVNRVAPQMRVKGTGSQSDFELRNFLKQFPSIGNTPEGNAIIDATLSGFVQNKLTAAEIGSKALSGEISRSAADKAIRDLPDPMEGWRKFNKAQKNGMSTQTEQADPAALAEAKRRGLIK